MDFYNNTVLVEFNNKLAEWKIQHDAALETAKSEKNNAEHELNNHYESTKIIPAKYHNISTLEYIYSLISSSQYSLKECFDDYERNEAKKLEEERIHAQLVANQIAETQANLTAEQNDLLNEQNVIAEKARRDQNISNLTRAIQHHNTNKILKGK